MAATTLRWATVLPANHPGVTMMERVAKQVREDTGGAVEIQVFPAGQLGSSRDLIEATSNGAIQIVDEGAAQFGQFVPQFSILEAPYIWRDVPQMRRVLNSPITEEMNAQLVAKRQMRIVGATYYGKRHVTAGTSRLKVLREWRELSQSALARRCNVNSQYISALEKSRRNIGKQVAKKLAPALGVSIAVLVG